MHSSSSFQWPVKEVQTGAIALLFVLALLLMNLVKVEAARGTELPTLEEFSAVPSLNALPWLSLGYDESLADLLWIRALQYNHFNPQLSISKSYADAILKLDPDFEAAYRWIAVSSIFSENISLAAVQQAIDYLELAAKRFPNTAYYHYNIALNYISYYPHRDEHEREHNRRLAIWHLQQAMQKLDANSGIVMLISGLLNHDKPERKLEYLKNALLIESDNNNKRLLQMRMILLSERDDNPDLMLYPKSLHWKETHKPYLPDMLNYFLGTP